MLEASVEDVELQDADKLDDLDYMDDEFESGESSLLREPDETKRDASEVGTLYLICLAIGTGG